MAEHGLGLADVLEQLGEELQEAARRGGNTISFMSAEVELTVEVEVTGRGAVRFLVLDGEAAAARTTATRIRVSLAPHSDFQQMDGVGM
jgi:hypothetical protein